MKKLALALFLILALSSPTWRQSLNAETRCGQKFRAIRANAHITGKLKKKGGPDYYQVTLKRPGKLTASVRNHYTAVVDIQDGLCRSIPVDGSKTSRVNTLSPSAAMAGRSTTTLWS